MRVVLCVGLLLLSGVAAAATDDAAPVPPHVATVVLCDTTPVNSSYAQALAEGYARILDPNPAPAGCVSTDPYGRELPPTGFDALLVLTFKKTELDRPLFDGELKLVTRSGRRGWGGFIAQRRKVPNGDRMEERLALGSVILPLAFNLGLIPDPFPNSPPEDLPAYDATMSLPSPSDLLPPTD